MQDSYLWLMHKYSLTTSGCPSQTLPPLIEALSHHLVWVLGFCGRIWWWLFLSSLCWASQTLKNVQLSQLMLTYLYGDSVLPILLKSKLLSADFLLHQQ